MRKTLALAGALLAMPAAAQAATTCYAEIINGGSGGSPASYFRVTKGATVWNHPGAVTSRRDGVWLRFFFEGGEVADMGGCDAGHSIASMENTAQDYMELDLGRRYP